MFRRPQRTIIPQYTTPRGVSLMAAAEVLGDGKRAIAAQIIDFAVRKVVTIARDAAAGKRSGFTITLQDATREGPDEQAILVTLFGNELYPGSVVYLHPGRNRELGAALKHPHRWIVGRLIHEGLVRERTLASRLVTPWRKEPVEPTEQAEPLVDYLWGIHDYVELAEKRRYEQLQAPETVARRAPYNELEVLVLNERLLPYAVLFGLEKQWMKELDVQLRDLPPQFLDDVGDLLLVAAFLGDGIEIVAAVSDLIDIADAVEALDGVGAIFGGVGEFLGDLDFPDFG